MSGYRPQCLGGPELPAGSRVIATEAAGIINDEHPGPLRGVVCGEQDRAGRLLFTVDQDGGGWAGYSLYAETWEAEPA